MRALIPAAGGDGESGGLLSCFRNPAIKNTLLFGERGGGTRRIIHLLNTFSSTQSSKVTDLNHGIILNAFDTNRTGMKHADKFDLGDLVCCYSVIERHLERKCWLKKKFCKGTVGLSVQLYNVVITWVPNIDLFRSSSRFFVLILIIRPVLYILSRPFRCIGPPIFVVVCPSVSILIISIFVELCWVCSFIIIPVAPILARPTCPHWFSIYKVERFIPHPLVGCCSFVGYLKFPEDVSGQYDGRRRDRCINVNKTSSKTYRWTGGRLLHLESV